MSGERQAYLPSRHFQKHAGKDRNDEDHQDADHDHGHTHNGRGVDHGALDLALQLHGLFNVFGQTSQDRIEQTADLTGMDQVHIQFVKDLGMLFQGIGKRGTGLHVKFDFRDRFGEDLVLRLGGKNLQTLDERKAGVDHGRELAGKDSNFLVADPAAQRQALQYAFGGFYFQQARDDDILPAKLLRCFFTGLGGQVAFPDRALLGFTNVGKCGHQRSGP